MHGAWNAYGRASAVRMSGGKRREAGAPSKARTQGWNVGLMRRLQLVSFSSFDAITVSSNLNVPLLFVGRHDRIFCHIPSAHRSHTVLIIAFPPDLTTMGRKPMFYPRYGTGLRSASIHTFRGIREEKFYHIDRTGHFLRRMHDGKCCFLLCPRRFDKNPPAETPKEVFRITGNSSEAWQFTGHGTGRPTVRCCGYGFRAATTEIRSGCTAP